MKRKKFLHNVASFAAGVGLYPLMVGHFPESSVSLTLLHTNDTLGYVRPLPPHSGVHAGKGGMARRASLVNQIEQNQNPVVLADAGNVMGDTVFSDFYNGTILYRMMNDIGYEVACVGRNDLKNGIPVFLDAAGVADFPFVLSNYHIEDERLDRLVNSYTIIEKESLRIGFFGLGRNPQYCGLPSNVSSVLEYRNPILVAGAMSRKLKYAHNCHLVIGLSRLGFPENDRNNRITDWDICEEVEDVDMIIGGPDRRFMKRAYRYERRHQQPTLVSQAGYGGAMMGKTVFTFTRKQEKRSLQNIFSSSQSVTS